MAGYGTLTVKSTVINFAFARDPGARAQGPGGQFPPAAMGRARPEGSISPNHVARRRGGPHPELTRKPTPKKMTDR